MYDQADRLRRLALKEKEKIEQEIVRENKYTRVIVVSSGKGGVGKSTLSLNIALNMCKRGNRVILMDADLGLANIDIMLGIVPKFNLYHMVQEKKDLREIIISRPEGLSIIPGGSGITELANLKENDCQRVIREIGKLEGEFDYMIVDTGAGISNNVISFLLSADDIIMVTTPEPTAITDVYGVIKAVAKRAPTKPIYLVVNRVANNSEGIMVADKLKLVCERFLNLKIQVLGYVVNETIVEEAIRRQQAFILIFPRSLAARNIDSIVTNLIKANSQKTEVRQTSGGIRQFFKKVIGLS